MMRAAYALFSVAAARGLACDRANRDGIAEQVRMHELQRDLRVEHEVVAA